ncbi:MAG: radical SAM protein [Clostridia bacterium]|nr:radical SAM protein [Clostridia bacterium]
MGKIKTAWLTTNRTCNNNCEWCYAQNKFDNSIMDFEKSKRAVDLLKKNGISKIVLIGGEPTIYSHFFDLISYVKQKKLSLAIATNGRMFKNYEFSKKVVDLGVDSVNISLKAIDEESYKKNTRCYGLTEMLDGYKNLKRLSFNPSVSYVIVNDDILELRALIKLLKENEISRIFLQFVKPVVEENNLVNPNEIIKMGRFLTTIYNEMECNDIDYNVEVSFPLCLIEKDILLKLIAENRIRTGCHIQNGSGIVFDTEFKVLPCNHFANYPFDNSSIDLLDNNSINKLWNSDEVKIFRKRAQCYPSKQCIECELWNKCGGGCFTRWLFTDLSEVLKQSNLKRERR